jgi:hypothetical protein
MFLAQARDDLPGHVGFPRPRQQEGKQPLFLLAMMQGHVLAKAQGRLAAQDGRRVPWQAVSDLLQPAAHAPLNVMVMQEQDKGIMPAPVACASLMEAFFVPGILIHVNLAG